MLEVWMAMEIFRAECSSRSDCRTRTRRLPLEPNRVCCTDNYLLADDLTYKLSTAPRRIAWIFRPAAFDVTCTTMPTRKEARGLLLRQPAPMWNSEGGGIGIIAYGGI